MGHLSDYINISQASKKIIASMQQRIRSHWECCLEQNTTKGSSAICNDSPCSQKTVSPMKLVCSESHNGL